MKMSWLAYAIVAMVSFAAMFLVSRKVLDTGVTSQAFTFYIFLLVTLMLFAYVLATKTSLSLTKYAVIFLIAAAVFSAVGNVVFFQAIKLAPNPGYAVAIMSTNALLVTIASIFLFKAQFSVVKVMGIILAVVGVILLGL